MFEELSRKLEGVLKKLRGQGKITEVNIAETLREVRRVLLDADVNFKVAKQFVEDVRKKALGQEVRYNEVSPDVYRGFGFPGAEDMGNMFQFKRDFEKDYCAARSLDVSRSLNPSLLTFDQWLAKNKGRIPLE